jgi:hypothetical protein
MTMATRTEAEIKRLSEHMSLSVTPFDWLEKAKALRRASDQLFTRFEEEKIAYDEEMERAFSFERDPPDASIFMMLLGFAIENLIKGLHVSTLSIVKSPRTIEELGVSTHRLTVISGKIAKVLDEKYTKREIDILAGIEQSILWHGRYPSPVRADKLVSTSDYTLFSAPVFRYPEDHFDTCTLFDRLQSWLRNRARFTTRKTGLSAKLGIKRRIGIMPGEPEGS